MAKLSDFFLSSTSGGFSSNGSFSEDFWRQNFHGGWATFIALFLLFLWHSSRRFSFSFPFPSLSRSSSSYSSVSSALDSPANLTASSSQRPQFGTSEIVSAADLMFLMENLDEKSSMDEEWESVIDKRNNLLSYSAKCCKTKDGPLKYLSVTVFENCSPEILRDFYMDNDYRKQWDKTIVGHWQLHVDENHGVEVGRTIKKFPLLTPREYVLAWRLWEGKDKSFYCFIKECEHPLAPKQKKYVRVSTFRSGWRIRKVPGRDACEIKMFHQEDAGLNVEMAKLIFSKGIWSYICKMDNALRKYPTIRQPLSSSGNGVTLIKMVPPELDTSHDATSQANSALIDVHKSVTGLERKLSRRPSRKMVANGLLLIGGVICVSHGHSSFAAKVVMAHILSRLRRHGASSSQGNQNFGT